MSMWLTFANEGSTCHRCKKPYKVGEPLGVISLDSQFVFAHPLCWLSLGLEELRKPKVSKLGAREERKLLLHYWATLNDREKKAISKEGAAMEVSLSFIRAKRVELAAQMKDLGGVPKGWKERMKE